MSSIDKPDAFPADVWVVFCTFEPGKLLADYVADYRQGAMEHAAECAGSGEGKAFGPYKVARYVHESMISAEPYSEPPFAKATPGNRKWPLLPCPFCGASPKVKEIKHHYWNVCIECPRCWCKTGEYNNASHFRDMVQAWNRRPAEVAVESASRATIPQLGIKDPRPCAHPIGLTTCGYPQEHRIHEGSAEPAPPAGRHVYTPPADENASTEQVTK